MDVDGNVIHIIISEDGIPNLWVQNLSVVHDEPSVGYIFEQAFWIVYRNLEEPQ